MGKALIPPRAGAKNYPWRLLGSAPTSGPFIESLPRRAKVCGVSCCPPRWVCLFLARCRVGLSAFANALQRRLPRLSCRPFGIRQFSDKLVGGLGWANSHNHLGLAPRLRMRFRLYLPSTPCGRSTVKPEPSFRLGFAPISYAWSVTVCGSGLSLPPSHC